MIDTKVNEPAKIIVKYSERLKSHSGYIPEPAM